jgi:aryl-alcohol dehydrogenase-like predicted oxidoreductase
MRYQQLGEDGPTVSTICLGTWQMGGEWGPDYDDAIAAVGVAYDLGIDFYDTAYAYGEGAAEVALAKGLGDLLVSHRDELTISTKGGLEMRPGQAGGPPDVYRNSDAPFLRRCLEASLRSLGLEYVDVYFIHWPDPTIPFEETAGVVGEFVAEGLVRQAGVSNFSVEQMEAFSVGQSIGVTQLPYSLLDRRVEEELLPFCAERGIGVMGWSGLAHGILTGTLRRGQVFPAGDWRAEHPAFAGGGFDRVMDWVEELTEIAAGHGCSLPQLALAWILSNPAGVVPVIGAQVPAHIVDSAAAVDVELGDEDLRRIAEAAERVPAFSLGAEKDLRLRR